MENTVRFELVGANQEVFDNFFEFCKMYLEANCSQWAETLVSGDPYIFPPRFHYRFAEVSDEALKKAAASDEDEVVSARKGDT